MTLGTQAIRAVDDGARRDLAHHFVFGQRHILGQNHGCGQAIACRRISDRQPVIARRGGENLALHRRQDTGDALHGRHRTAHLERPGWQQVFQFQQQRPCAVDCGGDGGRVPDIRRQQAGRTAMVGAQDTGGLLCRVVLRNGPDQTGCHNPLPRSLDLSRAGRIALYRVAREIPNSCET